MGTPWEPPLEIVGINLSTPDSPSIRDGTGYRRDGTEWNRSSDLGLIDGTAFGQRLRTME